jgi:hypothetical protein
MDYQYGLRPPKNSPALQFSDFWNRTLPTYPPSANYLADLKGGWKLLGNDFYGNCAAVLAANLVRQLTAHLDTEYYPTQEEVFELYKTQNPRWSPGVIDPTTGLPDPGKGMDLQTLLEWWHTHTWGSQRVLAFAQVHPQEIDECRAALAIFGNLCLGVKLTQVNLDQFDHNLPWDYNPINPIKGLHGVFSGGYTGSPYEDICIVTWGKTVTLTDAFFANQVIVAYVVITPENLGTEQFIQGCSLDALKSAYLMITGNPLPDPNAPIPSAPPGCLSILNTILRGGAQ